MQPINRKATPAPMPKSRMPPRKCVYHLLKNAALKAQYRHATHMANNGSPRAGYVKAVTLAINIHRTGAAKICRISSREVVMFVIELTAGSRQAGRRYAHTTVSESHQHHVGTARNWGRAIVLAQANPTRRRSRKSLPQCMSKTVNYPCVAALRPKDRANRIRQSY